MDVREEYVGSEERRTFLTNDLLRDMVGIYLRSIGMNEVATKMYAEAKTIHNNKSEADETNERLLLLLMNRCAVPRPTTSHSIPPCELEWILSPHTTTRAVIRRLLSNAKKKLTRQFHSMHLPRPDELSQQHILYSNHVNMWSPQDDADALYVKGKKGKGPGMLLFGTLNQLIEELTHVSVLPLSSLSEEKVLAQEKFTFTFLRQHRYFALSHTVLAKLMERFLLPFSIKLTFEHFEGHGISIHAPGTSLSRIISTSQVTNNVTENKEENNNNHNYHNHNPLSRFSPSASLWLCVYRKIQLRVLSVLTLWLHKYPQHFDEEMRQCLSLFLEDACYTSQPWSDCPSQLTEMAEFLRCYLTEKDNKSLQREQECSSIKCSCQSFCQIPPTLESFPITCTKRNTHQTNSSIKTSLDEPLSILSLTNTKDFTIQGESLDDTFITSAKEVLQLFMSVSVDDYATTLTSLHRELFASLQGESLLHMTYRSSGVYLCSTYFRHSSLGIFLSTSSDLSAWVVSVLLHSAVVDSHELRHLRVTTSPGEKFINVYSCMVDLVVALLRLNNLHGAIGIYNGLQHPFIQRLMEHPRLSPLFPVAKLQNISYLGSILRYDSEKNNSEINEDETVKFLENYLGGLFDADIHPPVPPIQPYLKQLNRLQEEMPSFLTVRKNELYPQFVNKVASENIVVVNWRKYMIIEEMLTRIIAWQITPKNNSRDETFELQFANQKQYVVQQPWLLARMVNEFICML
ncbi:uncharacterized protein TM35_000112130 [Trypanosoma theileri]|uniref:Ras-GEF domain-containing protein n=1 Tax=Trypanosoma theileri TaxID=67003 RepID=A0A1X0NZN9_9TRYP|nr:uncharacterized protein TM35_000112130 [Trypanosoma theileri]ORC89679.1 hypothetical protein TM35_000112130 [Trypanosoma theileri]